MLIHLPQWAQIFLMSMIPGVEARLTVPFIAIGEFGWPW